MFEQEVAILSKLQSATAGHKFEMQFALSQGLLASCRLHPLSVDPQVPGRERGTRWAHNEPAWFSLTDMFKGKHSISAPGKIPGGSIRLQRPQVEGAEAVAEEGKEGQRTKSFLMTPTALWKIATGLKMGQWDDLF